MAHAHIRDELEQLFRRTEEAHHKAFPDRSGGDPDWPIWYADQLQQPLEEIGGMSFLKSRLIYCLMNAHYEREVRASEKDWAAFAADRFMECYAATETPKEDDLVLYYFPSCPYCRRVLQAIDRLAVSVELRNINEDDTYRRELLAARGRATVPVLRIDSPGGGQRWMPESRDIVDWLERTYG